MLTKDRFSLSAWVEESVRDFTKSPANNQGDTHDEPAFDVPLVGFSSGDDPLYAEFKRLIGPFHWTPTEAFTQAFPDVWITPEQLTVITWILPQTRATKADQRKETVHASERWLRSRKFGEEFNAKLRDYMVSRLSDAGYQAVAPANLSSFSMKAGERCGMASTWSERHAAYAAGLGTFGLCDGLITPVGKAMRCGSVVARLSIPCTPRPYNDPHAYCLFFSQEGACGKCMGRCPAGAISPQGHDKGKCRQYIETVERARALEAYGLEAYGCGLCQTKVPCESRIPSTKTKGDQQ